MKVKITFPVMTFQSKVITIHQSEYEKLTECEISSGEFIYKHLTESERRFNSETSLDNAVDVGYAKIEKIN